MPLQDVDRGVRSGCAQRNYPGYWMNSKNESGSEEKVSHIL